MKRKQAREQEAERHIHANVDHRTHRSQFRAARVDVTKPAVAGQALANARKRRRFRAPSAKLP